MTTYHINNEQYPDNSLFKKIDWQHNYKTYYMPNHKQAACRVHITDDGTRVLQSYNTLVAAYNPNTKTIECSGTYSNTTTRHIGWFAQFFVPGANYYTFKDAINKDVVML